MLRSVEKRFGDRLPDTPVQWLTDNGSAYTAHETRRFARELNLEPCTTAVSSPRSNGMAERFVKTMKEDYIAFMPKPYVRTDLRNLAAAFTHYNENHPHSALGYHSLREYLRLRTSLTEDTKAVWIWRVKITPQLRSSLCNSSASDDIRNLPMFSSPIQLRSGWTPIHD